MILVTGGWLHVDEQQQTTESLTHVTVPSPSTSSTFELILTYNSRTCMARGQEQQEAYKKEQPATRPKSIPPLCNIVVRLINNENNRSSRCKYVEFFCNTLASSRFITKSVVRVAHLRLFSSSIHPRVAGWLACCCCCALNSFIPLGGGDN